jgi:nitroreductase
MKTPTGFALSGLGALVALAGALVWAQEGPPDKLPAPRTTGGKPLMEALKERKSTREFKAQALPRETLSNLLWAAFGINRPDSGKRTAPTAINSQEIDVYVLLAEGAFVYEPKEHRLLPVAAEDLRKAAGGRPSFADASVHLIFVADSSRMNARLQEKREVWSACHCGFIGQNVYLFCASEGLGTVFHASVNREALKGPLKLKPEQEIAFAQVVGLPKE